MVKMHIVYEGDLHTIVTHEPSGQTLHTDAPLDVGGKGRTFSPTDLLGAALGTCIATVMGMYAEKKGIDLRGMQLKVDKKMSPDAPRRISTLSIHVWIPLTLPRETQVKLERVAKSCPVHQSLHPEVEVAITFHWKEA
jgi:putative redox protein